jgi:zinc transport system substrate-binding protein
VSNSAWVLVLLIALAVAASTLASASAGPPRGLKVVVTAPPLVPLVKALGGPYVDVEGIIPPGADPHTYSPPASVVAKLDYYDLIVMTGPHHMRVEDIILELRSEGKLRHPLILYYANYTRCGLHLLELRGHENVHGYWWGPRSLAVISRCVGEALARLDPEHAGWYLARADLYANSSLSLIGSLQGIKVAAYSPIAQYLVEESGGVLAYTLVPAPSAEAPANSLEGIVRLYREGKIEVFVVTYIDYASSRSVRVLVENLGKEGVPTAFLPLGEPGLDPLEAASQSIGAIHSALEASGRGAGVCGGSWINGWGVAVASFLAGLGVMTAWVRRA